MRCGGHAHTSNMEAVNAGVACGCEFCWVCMEIIEPGKGHQCNSYRATGRKGSKKDEQQTKEDDINYLSHYYERYEHHHGSRKYIDRDKQALECKYDDLSADSTLAVAVDPYYLIEACELLVEVRRDLKWSYAAAYFLKPSPQKNFFEFLQGDLEQDVELLAQLLEHDVPGPSAGYEDRAVHKTRTTSRMNGVRQKLQNLEYHAAQDFAAASDAVTGSLPSGPVSENVSDSLLERRRRRTRMTTARMGRTADRRVAQKISHDQLTGSMESSGFGVHGECANCTFKNDAGSSICKMCGELLTSGTGLTAAVRTPTSAATCPEWATPCRDGKSCTKQADEIHLMQYWHPPT